MLFSFTDTIGIIYVLFECLTEEKKYGNEI